ncbi:hypothetical protein AXF42_Ash008702 [Apostasia shenzhenica]|uniref:Uncharacterized protein n=1 Tax=Apostasia shenzhenica TaxID=1088818 RepID=A0A2I0B257_9ASPA|nr:hypothetical protein AXF42_Ash008702 [Apostasia shenzhenica]
MSSACKSAVGCLDAGVPSRLSYVNLHKWAESDAEFVRSVAAAGYDDRRSFAPAPRVVDSYSCRQMYLRSYTFSKKETVPEKTIKCFARVKDRAADLPFINHRRKYSGADGSFSSFNTERSCRRSSAETKQKKKKKGCSLFFSIFRRLLLCTASVYVAVAGSDDGRRRPAIGRINPFTALNRLGRTEEAKVPYFGFRIAAKAQSPLFH